MLIKKEKIKETIKQHLANCETHGLSNAFKTEKKSLQLMWLILVVAASAGCAYFIFKSCADFLAYDVITNIDVTYEQPLKCANF